MAKRDWYEHLAVISTFPKGQIPKAARKNVCHMIQCLECHAWVDGEWNQGGKKKATITKVSVCAFTWKQNIGHLGKRIQVMGVHGHYRTMNMQFGQDATTKLWRNIYELIVKHDVYF